MAAPVHHTEDVPFYEDPRWKQFDWSQFFVGGRLHPDAVGRGPSTADREGDLDDLSLPTQNIFRMTNEDCSEGRDWCLQQMFGEKFGEATLHQQATAFDAPWPGDRDAVAKTASSIAVMAKNLVILEHAVIKKHGEGFLDDKLREMRVFDGNLHDSRAHAKEWVVLPSELLLGRVARVVKCMMEALDKPPELERKRQALEKDTYAGFAERAIANKKQKVSDEGPAEDETNEKNEDKEQEEQEE